MELGNIIAALRRERGVTQEALAEAAGVTVQAVSKWENGGAPDTALLPAIADFFKVPMDTLFGRDGDNHTDIRETVRRHLKRIAITNDENAAELGNTREMTKELTDIVWAAMQQFINPISDKIETVAENRRRVEERYENTNAQQLENGEKPIELPRIMPSRSIVDGGTLYASLKGLPYFMVMPEPEGGYAAALPDIGEIAEVLAVLGNADTLRTIVWLCKRPLQEGYDFKAFTKNAMCRELEFTPEQADEQLKVLSELQFITKHELELDDKVVYYKPTISISPILPLIAIAWELQVKRRGELLGFAGHRWNNDRVSLL